MRLCEAAERSFARHETFHPRYGWFRKAYTVAAEDPGVFGREEAPVVIGVGKNMVRAIRVWGLAAKLIVEDPQSPNRRAPRFVPTWRGHALFGPDGWDPYMEDPGTLWLLHWLLLARRCRLPVWWLAFNEFHAVEFTEMDLEEAVTAQLEAVAAWAMPHPSSLKKDLSALVRTYSAVPRTGRVSIDDVLDSPLRELKILERSRATGSLRFRLGSKPTLPPQIVAHATLDYLDRYGRGGRTVTISSLVHEPGTPGRVFRLNEAELLESLKLAADDCDELRISAPAGAWQLAWSDEPEAIAAGLLHDYYGASPQDARSGLAGDEPVGLELLPQGGLGTNATVTKRADGRRSRERRPEALSPAEDMLQAAQGAGVA